MLTVNILLFNLNVNVPGSNSDSNDIRNDSMVARAFWKFSRMCWSKSASY